MICASSRSRSSGPQLIRENFDPPEMLKAIACVGHRLARATVMFRESAGNLDPETLEVLIRPILSDNELECLDFSDNSRVVGEVLASDIEEEYIEWEPTNRSRVPNSRAFCTLYLI
ncbi:hypothetical protein DPMN_094255 [Dreissena polymorpha]|uniref:Uncharacterized protein n=1 Tax=Dreissena polymorpha TaxID=45954 RepID=A0A9D4L5F8_DREPO|nr:hypothetical protein DPMN_094255 [Dreissena polymorpha]